MELKYLFASFFTVSIFANKDIKDIEALLKRTAPDLSLDFAINENKILEASKDLYRHIESQDWNKVESTINELQPLYDKIKSNNAFLSDNKDTIKGLKEGLDSVNSEISKLNKSLALLSDHIDSKRSSLIAAIREKNSNAVIDNSILLDIADIKDLLNEHGSKKAKLSSDIENIQNALVDSNLDFTQDELRQLKSILKQKKIDQAAIDDLEDELSEKMNLRLKIESEALSQELKIADLTAEIEEYQKQIDSQKMGLKQFSDLKDSILDAQDFIKRVSGLRLLYKDFESAKKESELLKKSSPLAERLLEQEAAEIKEVVKKLPRILDFRLSDSSSGIKNVIEQSPIQERPVNFDIKAPKIRQDSSQPLKDRYQGFKSLLKGVRSEQYDQPSRPKYYAQGGDSSYILNDQKKYGPLRSNELAEATDRTVWGMPERVL